MNVFQQNYDTRLRSWYELRTKIESLNIQTKCVEIDRWWQDAPLVNHHLHILDSNTWPGPRDLLVENTYCTVARAVGMCYTLSLVGITDIKMIEATDKMGEDLALQHLRYKMVEELDQELYCQDLFQRQVHILAVHQPQSVHQVQVLVEVVQLVIQVTAVKAAAEQVQ